MYWQYLCYGRTVVQRKHIKRYQCYWMIDNDFANKQPTTTCLYFTVYCDRRNESSYVLGTFCRDII